MPNRSENSRRTKRHAYKTLLNEAQSALPYKAERRFSRFIHSYAIERASELLETTVARPCGLVGASITSATGLSILYVFSIQGNFILHGSEVMLLWVLGYFAGLVVEALRYIIRRN